MLSDFAKNPTTASQKFPHTIMATFSSS